MRFYAYISGSTLVCQRTGQMFSRETKRVDHVRLLLPDQAPSWIQDLATDLAKAESDKDRALRNKTLQRLSDRVEQAEKRLDAQVYREFQLSLQKELSFEQNLAFIEDFVTNELCRKGMVVTLAVHNEPANPHVHLAVLTRELTATGLDPKKQRAWNRKDLLQEIRDQVAVYGNNHLQRAGFDPTLDARSYKDQGIEIEPQVKIGRKSFHREKKAGLNPYDPQDRSMTEMGAAARTVSLQNLYTILSRPETVLDIASRGQSTFMWRDVEKVLLRYVDEYDQYTQIKHKILSSPELVTLEEGGAYTQHIFSTRTIVAREARFYATLTALDQQQDFAVRRRTLDRHLKKANKALKKTTGNPEASLSEDQVQALAAMSDGRAVQFIEGYAGAGKTTVMETMAAIWRDAGYAVYGLAPTGRAQNALRQSGLEAQTLHKFLRDYQRGQNRLKAKSILVLDEAGMVDSARYTQLLALCQHHHWKLVSVGDREQLAAIDAGVPFRRASDVVGKVDLTTVLRQRAAWQREATVAFGQGQSHQALAVYQQQGCFQYIQEEPEYTSTSPHTRSSPEAMVVAYLTARRISGGIHHYIKEAALRRTPVNASDRADLKHWSTRRQEALRTILQNLEVCRPYMKDRGVDPQDFVDKVITQGLDKDFYDRSQHAWDTLDRSEKIGILMKKLKLTWGPDCGSNRGADCGSGKQKNQVDVRAKTRTALVDNWFQDQVRTPDQVHVMMAFANQDVGDLNAQARVVLRAAGQLQGRDRVFRVATTREDDFRQQHVTGQDKSFAVGDRILFTQNNRSLGVQNGQIAIIKRLNGQKIEAEILGEQKRVSFAPALFPHFDQGWALGVYKSQGSTFDTSHVLASAAQYKNLMYVAMTRHRDRVKVFCSSLDFWREDRIIPVLARSETKLNALDYLTPDQIDQVKRQDQTLLKRSVGRFKTKVEAVGYLGKRLLRNLPGVLTAGRLKRIDDIVEDPTAKDHHRREGLRALDRAAMAKDRDRDIDRDVAMGRTKDVAMDIKEAATPGPQETGRCATEHPIASSLGASSLGASKPPKATSQVSMVPKGAGADSARSSEQGTEQETEQPLKQRSEKKVPSKARFRAAASKQASTKRYRLEKLSDQAFKDYCKDLIQGCDPEIAAINLGLARNDRMSTGTMVRFGRKGSLQLNRENGLWTNYETGATGNLIDLCREHRGFTYRESLDYLARFAPLPRGLTVQEAFEGRLSLSPYESSYEGRSQSSPSHLSQDPDVKAQQRKNQAAETAAKLKDVHGIVALTKALAGTPAETYLRTYRGIQGPLPQDVRMLPAKTVFTYQGKPYTVKYGALAALSRDAQGQVRAVQVTPLTEWGQRATTKAGETLSKLTFGLPKGSYVDLGFCQEDQHANKAPKDTPLIIGEGVETVLSLKETGLAG